jgi:hypothetical protein
MMLPVVRARSLDLRYNWPLFPRKSALNAQYSVRNGAKAKPVLLKRSVCLVPGQRGRLLRVAGARLSRRAYIYVLGVYARMANADIASFIEKH